MIPSHPVAVLATLVECVDLLPDERLRVVDGCSKSTRPQSSTPRCAVSPKAFSRSPAGIGSRPPSAPRSRTSPATVDWCVQSAPADRAWCRLAGFVAHELRHVHCTMWQFHL